MPVVFNDASCTWTEILVVNVRRQGLSATNIRIFRTFNNVILILDLFKFKDFLKKSKTFSCKMVPRQIELYKQCALTLRQIVTSQTLHLS